MAIIPPKTVTLSLDPNNDTCNERTKLVMKQCRLESRQHYPTHLDRVENEPRSRSWTYTMSFDCVDHPETRHWVTVTNKVDLDTRKGTSTTMRDGIVMEERAWVADPLLKLDADDILSEAEYKRAFFADHA